MLRYGFIGDGSEASSFDGDRNDKNYEGMADEVYLYDEALTPDEIYHQTQDLTSEWSFEEGGGSIVHDDRVHHFHGETRGNPTWGDGYMQFDGSDDYVPIHGLVYNGTNYEELTLTAWIKTSAAYDNMIISYDRSEYYRFSVRSGKTYMGYYNSADNTIYDLFGSTKVNDSKWHYLTARFDHGDVTFFVDGEKDGSWSHGSTIGSGLTRYGGIAASSEATAFDSGLGAHYEGKIADVSVHNGIVSQDTLRVHLELLSRHGHKTLNELGAGSKTLRQG